MCARQYTFFYKPTSHTAFHPFQTDARSSEATLPVPAPVPHHFDRLNDRWHDKLSNRHFDKLNDQWHDKFNNPVSTGSTTI
jgi:hypothetical protein